jgi:hypothetical protein
LTNFWLQCRRWYEGLSPQEPDKNKLLKEKEKSQLPVNEA